MSNDPLTSRGNKSLPASGGTQCEPHIKRMRLFLCDPEAVAGIINDCHHGLQGRFQVRVQIEVDWKLAQMCVNHCSLQLFVMAIEHND